jgi:hypothetical protein
MRKETDHVEEMPDENERPTIEDIKDTIQNLKIDPLGQIK